MWAVNAMFPNGKGSLETYAQVFRQSTGELIRENSFKIDGIPGTRVDIVSNVLNLLTVGWVSDYMVCPNNGTRHFLLMVRRWASR